MINTATALVLVIILGWMMFSVLAWGFGVLMTLLPVLLLGLMGGFVMSYPALWFCSRNPLWGKVPPRYIAMVSGSVLATIFMHQSVGFAAPLFGAITGYWGWKSYLRSHAIQFIE